MTHYRKKCRKNTGRKCIPNEQQIKFIRDKIYTQILGFPENNRRAAFRIKNKNIDSDSRAHSSFISTFKIFLISTDLRKTIHG